MTEHPHEDVRRLFDMAMDVPASQRKAVLDRECAGDDGLKQRILAMVAAAEDDQFLGNATGGGLDQVTVESLPERAPASLPRETVGEQIGRYKLLEQIGEGGFGTVWAAEQREPVKRRVAIKIIKLGMDTKQVIARFEAERQALAMMDHPNIARVLDAGATETGRPFFAMELVKGVPILEYCDKEKLDTRARLDLFMKVCHAIQHAHQKGIIHRDIKPGNVLVTLHDGVPVPKVIDFGIAKATNQELTERTVYTQHHQMIGTPAYMSPEQAEMSGLDIDTRSDIYALGVLLYELLTGTTPFDTKSLMEAGFAEMMRIIREETPHKPSTRLSSLGETATRTAVQRHAASPEKLGLILRGDLDWIVMKCLEKDRSRRYETANGLAADIQRHLSDEPVVAGPPSAGYKMRKFVKRNRGQVVAGGVIAVLLVLGVVGTSSGMVRATASARAEKAAKLKAVANEQKAIEETAKAERELARATEIKRLITDILQSVSPEKAKGADTTLLRGILDEASARLETDTITDDLIAAELHAVVGGVYQRLGLYPQAQEHLELALKMRTRTLGAEHPDTLTSMIDLGVLYWHQGRYADAEPLYLGSLEIYKRVLSEDHPGMLRCLSNLGVLYSGQGRFGDAERLYLMSLEIKPRVLGEDHPSTLNTMDNLSWIYVYQGRYAEAVELSFRSLEKRRRVQGEEHPDTLTSMMSVAMMYAQQGQYDKAEPLYLKAFELQRRVLGEEHPNTAASLHSLAIVYSDQGRHAEAEPLYLKALEIRRRVLGEEHPDTLRTMNLLGTELWKQGRYAEAEPWYLKTLEIQKRVLGEEHSATLGTTTNLGLLYNSMGRYEDAAAMFETSLPIKRRVLGMQHPWTGLAINSLATAYMQLGRREEAAPLYRELLELQTAAANRPDADAQTLNATAWTLLTVEIEEMRDPVRALGFAERACAWAETAGSSNLPAFLDTLGLAQHLTGDTASAVQTQRRAISLMPEGADLDMAARLAEYEAAVAGPP